MTPAEFADLQEAIFLLFAIAWGAWFVRKAFK